MLWFQITLQTWIIFFPLTVFKGWELISNTLYLKGLGLCSTGYVFLRQQALCPVQKGMDLHFLHTSTCTSQIFALPLQRSQDVAGMCVFELPGCTEQSLVNKQPWEDEPQLKVLRESNGHTDMENICPCTIWWALALLTRPCCSSICMWDEFPGCRALLTNAPVLPLIPLSHPGEAWNNTSAGEQELLTEGWYSERGRNFLSCGLEWH